MKKLPYFAALLVLTACGEPKRTSTIEVERVSVASDGTEGDGMSSWSASSTETIRLSRDGQVVTFVSQATNLVPEDDDDLQDAFVHDRATKQTTRVSRLVTGTGQPTGGSDPTISGDGRYVAYGTVPGIAVFDRTTEETVLIASGHVLSDPQISDDGRHVVVRERLEGLDVATVLDWIDSTGALVSQSTDGSAAPAWDPVLDGTGNRFIFRSGQPLVAGAEGTQTYLHDRETGQTTLLSRKPDGTMVPDAGQYSQADLTPDGRWATLHVTLEPGRDEVYLVDLESGEMTFVSEGYLPRISDDGGLILFASPGLEHLTDETAAGDDLYVWTRSTQEVRYLFVSHHGGFAGAGVDSHFDISGDGRFAAFGSNDENIVPGDTNGVADVFVVGLEASIALQ